jgi:hypothetical protein
MDVGGGVADGDTDRVVALRSVSSLLVLSGAAPGGRALSSGTPALRGVGEDAGGGGGGDREGGETVIGGGGDAEGGGGGGGAAFFMANVFAFGSGAGGGPDASF